MGKVQAGGSFKIFRIGYNSVSPYGYDSPYSLTPGQNPFVMREQFRSAQSGAYIQSTANLTGRASPQDEPLPRYHYIASHRFSPRVALSYRMTDRLSWRASYGSYYQQPFFVFLAAFP